MYWGPSTKFVTMNFYIFLIKGEPCLSILDEDVPVGRGDQEQELQHRRIVLRTCGSFTPSSLLYSTSMTSKPHLQLPIQTLQPPVTCLPGQTLFHIPHQFPLPHKIPSTSVPWGHRFQTIRWGRASQCLHASLLLLHQCQPLAMLPCQQLLLGRAPFHTWCLLPQYPILPHHQSYHSKSTTSLYIPQGIPSSHSHHLTSIAISTTLAPFRAALPIAAVAAAIFGTRVSTREKSHKVIDDLRRGANTTTSTGTVSTVTSTVTGIDPITTGIVGIEAAVQTGGGRKAVGTGLNMTEEECRLIIEVMSVAGNKILSACSGWSMVVVLWSMNLCSLLPLAFPFTVGHSQCSAVMEGAALLLSFTYILFASPLKPGRLVPLVLEESGLLSSTLISLGFTIEVNVYVAWLG